jgi:DNA-binding response OmpR family regulator
MECRMAETRILCVDPDRTQRVELVDRLRVDLTELDPVVDECGDLEKAASAIDSGPIDCLVTEHDLPDGTGLELAGRVRAEHPDASVILFTDADTGAVETGDTEPMVTEYVDKSADAAPARVAALIEMTLRLRSQVSYPIPDDEEARLAAVAEYDFEDGLVARAFDRLTDLAVQRLDVSSASVNIIEEHEQRLLACRGLEADVDATSRDGSICTFTIVENDRVMTVEDVREDPRFAAKHESFEALGIRSYMGAQLVTSDGYRIGTLCVYDDQPREFPRRDQDYLRTLADLGVDLLAAQAGTEHSVVAGGADGTGDDQPDSAAEATDEATEDGTDALGEAFR